MTETSIHVLSNLWEEKSFSTIRGFLEKENPIDIAELLEKLEGLYEKSLPTVYRLLPKDIAAEVFVEFDSDIQKHLIDALSDKELAETLAEMFYDDTADLIEEMPANVVKRILKNASANDRSEINKLLKFKDGSAGSIMTTEFVNLSREMTVAESLDHIRNVGLDKETIYTCYVTDKTKKLEGFITALTLLTSPTDKTIGELMNESVISVKTDEDSKEASNILVKYDFLALPVTDSEGKLVGIVTIDDAVDVLKQDAEDNFSVMAAITPSESSYLKTPVMKLFLSRIPWLLLLMFTATFTGMIISSFEKALAAKVALTIFIPMLMGTGGNCGSQSSTTIIRSLSLGEIKVSDTLKVIFKEFRVALLCGGCLAIFEFVKMLTLDRALFGNEIDIGVSLTVSITLIATVLFAKIIGTALPIQARRLGLDPAVMASPFITTLVDTVTLLAYFTVASNLLNL